MNLKELVSELGPFTYLSGVDTHNSYGRGSFEDASAEVFSLILGNKVYSFIEDPEDGYRSCMGEIVVNEYVVKNTFCPVEVELTHCQSTSDDFILITDRKTKNVIAEVGTGNMDDYYPYFIARFHPENMQVNAEVLEQDPDKEKYWHEIEVI